MSESRPANPPFLWARPYEVTPLSRVKAIAGTPISVLAGFSLTGALEVAAREGGVARDAGIAGFSIAAAAFLITLCFVLVAETYSATPDQRLALRPEARLDITVLEEERKEQLVDLKLLAYHEKWIQIGFTVGVAAAVLGLAFAVLATRMTWGVIVAAAALVAVAAVQVLFATGQLRGVFRDHKNPPFPTIGPPAPIGTRGLAILQDRENGGAQQQTRGLAEPQKLVERPETPAPLLDKAAMSTGREGRGVPGKAPIEVRRERGQWVVARQGSMRPFSKHPTQKEAVPVGRDRARQDSVDFILKGRDGGIRKKESYASDPRQSRG